MSYASEAQLKLALNSAEVDAWGDVDGDGTAETGVLGHALGTSSALIWSIIKDRHSSTTAMDVANYTAGSGTYPILEYMDCQLGADILRHHNGGKPIDYENHPAIRWAKDVRMGLADI